MVPIIFSDHQWIASWLPSTNPESTSALIDASVLATTPFSHQMSWVASTGNPS